MTRKITPRVLALLGAVASGAASGSTPPVTANNSAIIYEGRSATDSAGAVRLGFPGVTVHLRFRGPLLALQARASGDGVRFDVSVDGAAPTVLTLHQGEGSYPLWQGVAGDHALTLTRRTESWEGTCEILGFDLGGGELLAAAALPVRKLMFIGDSVTCGAMTAYTGGSNLQDNNANSNARLAYGMILARRLGAQCHLVSYGGRGIIRDWQGIRDTNNAPQFYELALPDDPAVRWDHARYVPDAIGIQLGTNDFSPGVPDQNEFVNAYVEFIRKVRRDAPDALIFVMDSPIVKDDAAKGPRRTALHAYLGQIVARARDGKVVLAPLPAYPGVPGNGHPSGAEHEAMADELEPLLRRALGW
jgi:Carbohydrate esterase 2 N-terminal/GDSL-like Lipase/Acylhydrolase family